MEFQIVKQIKIFPNPNGVPVEILDMRKGARRASARAKAGGLSLKAQWSWKFNGVEIGLGHRINCFLPRSIESRGRTVCVCVWERETGSSSLNPCLPPKLIFFGSIGGGGNDTPAGPGANPAEMIALCCLRAWTFNRT